jgi:hypothetical protein
MSSSEDEEAEAEREYQREREMRRQKKPWERRLDKWGKTPATSTAKELLEICTFYAGLPEDEWDLQLYDTLENHGERIPPEEMATILDWYHKDKKKRKILNVLLCVYSYSTWGGYDEKAPGPEKFIVRGKWFELSPTQQEVIRMHGKMDAVSVWSEMYLDQHGGGGDLPDCNISWEFLADFGELLKKHSRKPRV